MTSRRRLTLGLLALALVAAAAAWIVLRSEREDGPPPPAARGPEAGEPVAAVALAGRAPEPPSAATDSPSADPLPSAAIPSEGYVIEGTVKDVATNAPLHGAQVIGSWEAHIPLSAEKRAFRSERREIRAEVLSGGRFRIRVDGSPPPHVRTFDLADSSSHVIRVDREGADGDAPPVPSAWGNQFVDVDTRPGSKTELTLWVRRAFRLAGIVQDSARRPLPDVQISFTVPQLGGRGNLILGGSAVSSGPNGEFDVGPFAHDPVAGIPEALADTVRSAAFLMFKHPDFAPLRLDPRDVPAGQRDRFVVTMTQGVTLAGSLVDARGRPLADVPVVVEYAGGTTELRRGVRTDAEGRWRLERLSPGQATLVARAFAHDAKARRDITLERDDLDVRLVAEAIRLERPHPTTTVLGLGLAEVDDDLRQAYDIPTYVNVVILDPGPDAKRLGIGDLEKGYGILMVGSEPFAVTSIRDTLDRLLSVSSGARSTHARVRIVYTFWNEQMEGTNTQYLSLSPERIEELKALRARLSD